MAIQLRGQFTEPVWLTQSRNRTEVSEDAHTVLNRGVFVEKAGQKTNNRVRRAEQSSATDSPEIASARLSGRPSASTEPLLAQAARWDFSSAASSPPK